MSNTWERAFGSIQPPENEDNIKQIQRNIQQQAWDEELPTLSSNLTEDEQIIKLLKEKGLYKDEISLVSNINEIATKYNNLALRMAEMQKAFQG